MPENKYGLKVISNQASYAATIALDSNQRMVAVKDYFSPVLTNWYYARPGNFTGQVLYQNPEVLVRLPVAKALARVQAALRQRGFSLLFYDAYRPYSVTEKMWKIVPDERYAANPAKGSGHNRGIAVDVTLADLATGRELAMPTGFDDFSEKAHHDYMQLDSAVIANRLLLRTVMQAYGFTALSTEWWHYSYTGNAATDTATRFGILNLPFEAFLRRADQSLK
ncbi:M15 family metallopeptidase [Filimonas effusa]|uniref:M15 family metallopeptidase n=1 Tax=Filimonas effusa TaxID=2508721 RepID=UPI0013E993DD|nr:M15 family metallopeptidase [Filimonas effusa]